jgi:histidinol phosphatase-like enzyme (inositol monophosphatase family)
VRPSTRVTLARRRHLLRAALTLARRSRAVVRQYMRAGFAKRLKADASYVTDADLAAERTLRGLIGARFPDHGIVGEEFPPVNPGASFQWILDPIDGTLSFTHGIPFFGTIIAVHHEGVPLVGVIDHPALGVCYSAAVGLGSWCDGRRLRIRDVPLSARSREVISASDRPRFVRCRRGQAFDRLMRAHPQVRGYADCIGHTLTAEGKIGATVDYGLRLWDIAATQVLIEEAGGRFACVHRSHDDGGDLYGIIAGKPSLVRWLERIFR